MLKGSTMNGNQTEVSILSMVQETVNSAQGNTLYSKPSNVIPVSALAQVGDDLKLIEQSPMVKLKKLPNGFAFRGTACDDVADSQPVLGLYLKVGKSKAMVLSSDRDVFKYGKIVEVDGNDHVQPFDLMLVASVAEVQERTLTDLEKAKRSAFAESNMSFVVLKEQS